MIFMKQISFIFTNLGTKSTIFGIFECNLHQVDWFDPAHNPVGGLDPVGGGPLTPFLWLKSTENRVLSRKCKGSIFYLGICLGLRVTLSLDLIWPLWSFGGH